MPTHELNPERGKDPWTITWDDETFSLTTPDGETICEGPSDAAYQVLDYYELFSENKVEFDSPAGFLTFKADKAALNELKRLIQDNLREDDEFRGTLKNHCLKIIPRGLIACAVGTTLFALYCWWAAVADAPPDWVRWFAWLIYLALLGCIGLAIGGPLAVWFAWKQLRLIRRIERENVDE